MQSTTEVPAGSAVGLVLRSTSFYAEAGGQTADTGVIATPSGSFDVEVRGLGCVWCKEAHCSQAEKVLRLRAVLQQKAAETHAMRTAPATPQPAAAGLPRTRASMRVSPALTAAPAPHPFSPPRTPSWLPAMCCTWARSQQGS